MIEVGVSWILFWALVKVFSIEVTMAAVVTGVVFILLGLLLGERPFTRVK